MELDFSKMRAVEEEDSNIDFETMQAADTEDKPVETPKPIIKQDLINEEFDIRKKNILENKDMLDTNKELLLNKNEQDRIDKLYDADIRDKDKKAKEEGVTAPERLNVGMGEAQGQLRVNIVAPIAEVLGMDDVAKEMREKGEVQIDTGKAVEKKFKEIYGDEAWNIAQSVGNLTPEIATAVLAAGRNITQATVGTGLEYARTGNPWEAGKTGIIDLFGGAIADRIFKLGKLSKFGEDINNLPPDKRDFANDAIDAMERAGIDKIDEQGRIKILSKIDFSKPSSEVSENLIKEMGDLKDEALAGVEEAYNLANKAVDKTIKIQIPTFGRNNSLFDDMILDEKAELAIKDINKKIFEKSRSGNLDATQIEALTRSIDGYSTKGGGVKIKGIIKAELRKMQEGILPDGQKGVYSKAREKFIEYGTVYTSRIQGKGGELGKSIEDILKEDTTYRIASKILKDGIDSNRAKALNDMGLSKVNKADALKDVLTRKLDNENLADYDGLPTIIGRYKGADKDGVKELLGDGYKKFDGMMKALEMIDNTLKEAPIDEALAKNIWNFVSNAAMVQVSPLYGYKGMVYEGKEIGSKIMFRKAAIELKSRVNKYAKSKAVANKLTKAINMSIASSEANFSESKEKETYPKNLIRKDSK